MEAFGSKLHQMESALHGAAFDARDLVPRRFDAWEDGRAEEVRHTALDVSTRRLVAHCK